MKTYFSIIEELKKEIPNDSASADMSVEELAAYKQGAEDYLEILKLRFGFREELEKKKNEIWESSLSPKKARIKKLKAGLKPKRIKGADKD